MKNYFGPKILMLIFAWMNLRQNLWSISYWWNQSDINVSTIFLLLTVTRFAITVMSGCMSLIIICVSAKRQIQVPTELELCIKTSMIAIRLQALISCFSYFILNMLSSQHHINLIIYELIMNGATFGEPLKILISKSFYVEKKLKTGIPLVLS